MQERKFTEQFAVVGTKTHKDMIEDESNRDRVSKAVIVRRALDAYFSLDDGEKPGSRGASTSVDAEEEAAF